MRKRTFVLLLLFVALVVGVGYGTQRAKAILTNGYYIGYFKGQTTGQPNAGHQVLWNCDAANPDAISNASSLTKQQFINLINYYRNNNAHPGCSSAADTWANRNTFGANFVIQTMRGIYSNYGSANFPSAAGVTDWEDRVMDPNVTMTYVSNYTFTVNSAFNDDIQDDTWHTAPSDTQPALVFKYNGTTKYVLKVSCGNPLGSMPGLPELATISRNATISPTPVVEQGQSVTGKFSLHYDSGGGSDGQVNYFRRLWVDADGSGNYSAGDTSLRYETGTRTVSSGSTVNLSNWTNTAPGGADAMCVAMRISAVSGSGTTIADTSWDVACTSVGRKPYFQVYGGDAMAGVYQADSTASCQTSANAGFSAWNLFGQPESTDYGVSFQNVGSGTEMATFALGKIYHFGSSLYSNSNPRFRSFANDDTSANTSFGLYGGTFGALPVNCDFVGSNDGSTVTTITGNANSTTLPTSIANGTHQTIVVTGDVYLSQNITYASTSWSGQSDIPSFKLVVLGGNLYLSPAVHRLDGVYIVERNSGAGGYIYTCGTSSHTRVGAANRFSSCNTPLTVYGAFAAKHIFLDRTRGTLNDASSSETYSSNNAAETFVYSPEVWIANTFNTSNVDYTSINGLPPRL